jgi:hypothetical protein
MPRPAGSTNISNYHYEVHQLTPDGEYITNKFFQSQKQICEYTGFSLSMINRLIADPSKTPRDKSRNIRVFRVQQPVEPQEKMETQTSHISDNTE